MSKQLYSVIYGHRNGSDHYVVRSNHFPLADEIIAALNLDFEWDRECLTVVPIEIKDIPNKNGEEPEDSWLNDDMGG